MALTYLATQSLRNAFGRVLREPRQLVAILFLSLNPLIILAVIAGILFLPITPGMRAIADDLLPGGIATRLDGFRATITILMLGLVFSALLNNRLIQFTQADIDLLFPTPTPSWQMLLGRLIREHLSSLAAAFFFWGMGVAPVLRLSGAPIWPHGLWGLLGLMFAFVIVNQIGAAILLQVSGRDGLRRLLRVLVVIQWLFLLGVAIAGGLAAIVGIEASLAFLIQAWNLITTTLLAPIGLAADLLLLPLRDDPIWPFRFGILVALDLISIALIFYGGQHFRELALSPLGRDGTLRRALRRSWNPIRFARLAWNPEQVESLPIAQGGVPAFGQGAFALVWVRLLETRRQLLRSGLAITILTLAPLWIVLRAESYSLGTLVLTLLFATSLGTQAIDDLRGHLQTTDIDLILPTPRWKLVFATLLGRLPIYWGSGILLLVLVGIYQPEARWDELGLLALWYPLQIMPLIGLRGALLFLFPQASLPSGGDPVQFALYTAFQGVVTTALLLFSFAPIMVAIGLSRFIESGRILLWLALFGTSLVMTVVGLAVLTIAYQRFEPRESL
jgi:hypothetical protein